MDKLGIIQIVINFKKTKKYISSGSLNKIYHKLYQNNKIITIQKTVKCFFLFIKKYDLPVYRELYDKVKYHMIYT